VVGLNGFEANLKGGYLENLVVFFSLVDMRV
jgi:hypothetical protein